MLLIFSWCSLFLQIDLICIWCLFISSLKDSSISCGVDLYQQIFSFSLSMSSFLLQSWRIVLLAIELLVVHLFQLVIRHFKYDVPLSSSIHCFWEIKYYLISIFLVCDLSLKASRIISLVAFWNFKFICIWIAIFKIYYNGHSKWSLKNEI